MDKTENGQPNDFGYVLLDLARRVAKGELGLHDDRSLLMPKAELINAINPITTRDIPQLINNQLLIPVEQDELETPLYHAVNCMEFLRFLEKLEQAGFPLVLQQAVAEMYHSLFWALSSDIEYEILDFKKEKGREPNKLELAYLRVINDWAVSNTMLRIEDDILAGKPEELDRIKERAAKWKRASLRGARLGFAEGEIEKLIRDIWKPPFQYFRGREIKAFIDIHSVRWTKEESSLIWGGHFDFALCDERGILCLAVEYQGTGHYGKTKDEKEEVSHRDTVKRSICDKAGVPLIQLDNEYAFLETHKRILQNFLEVFLKRRRDCKPVIELLRKQLNIICSNSTNSTLTKPQLANIRHRLDIYEIQGKGESVLGLLWDLHTLQAPLLSPLPSILNKLNY